MISWARGQTSRTEQRLLYGKGDDQDVASNRKFIKLFFHCFHRGIQAIYEEVSVYVCVSIHVCVRNAFRDPERLMRSSSWVC